MLLFSPGGHLLAAALVPQRAAALGCDGGVQHREEGWGAVEPAQVPWERPLRPHGLLPGLCSLKTRREQTVLSPHCSVPIQIQNQEKEKSRTEVLQAVGCHGCKAFHGLIKQLVKLCGTESLPRTQTCKAVS